MKILQVAPQVPLPEDSGGRIGIVNITRSLASLGHQVDLIMYTAKIPAKEIQEQLKGFCTPIFVRVDTGDSVAGAFKNLFSAIPYNISKYIRRGVADKVKEMIGKNNYDVVHLDHLHLAWLIPEIKKVAKVAVVLREHNVEMQIMERYYKNQSNLLLKSFAYMQYKKFINYEPAMCRLADAAAMITEVDEAIILQLDREINTKVIPAGVKEELFSGSEIPGIPNSLFHLGSLEWEPNLQGLQWFLEEVYPSVVRRIPGVKLFIYGRGIEKVKIPAGLEPNVEAIGYAEDISAAIADKQICIVPLQVGGGIRIKVLEMMAMGKLVVSTPVGKEGIQAENGKELIVAATRAQFADAIVSVMNQTELAGQIVKQAKNLIREKYTWSSIAKMFEELYISVRNRQ